MATIMNSTHNTDFLLSLTVFGAEDADSVVANGGKNSIENFTNMKGGTL
jgi:hypothetical protein